MYEYLYHISILLVPAVGLIMILIDYIKMREPDKIRKQVLFQVIVVAMIAIFSDLVSVFINGMSGNIPRIANWTASSVYFIAIISSLCGLIVLYEHKLNNNLARLLTMNKIMVSVLVIYVIVFVQNIFTRTLFYITYEGDYVRGNLYFVVFAIPFLAMALMFINISLSRKNVTRKLLVLAIFSTTPVIAGLAFDVLLSFSLITLPAFFISFLFFYLFIVRQNSQIDSLTKVYNRHGLDEYIQALSEAVSRKTYSFIIIDMDHFKDINDNFGHAEGDNALRNAAEVIRSSVRRRDYVARYGGDEFVVISENENVDAMIRNLESELEKFNASTDKPYSLAFSCGGDIYKADDPHTPLEFFASVDALMYAEKERRRTKAT